MTTIDGCHYETLGLGDFFLSKANGFTVQGRYRQVGQGTDSSAVAVEEKGTKVEILAPKTKGGKSAVLINGKDVGNLCDQCTIFKQGGIQVDREVRNTEHFTVYRSNSIILTIRAHPTVDLINIAYEMGASMKGKVSGLWGNFDGKACDANMASWDNQVKERVTGADSIFTDQSFKYDPNFRSPATPQFKTKADEDKAKAFCAEKWHDNKQEYFVCMYDMAETGSERVADDENDGVRGEMREVARAVDATRTPTPAEEEDLEVSSTADDASDVSDVEDVEDDDESLDDSPISLSADDDMVEDDVEDEEE